ncbi:MAG: transketolase [Gammaproteobacteria bacterium]|nr:transketolase [Gammaproteobacteria bacterium]
MLTSLANAIRFLSVDAVEQAKCGHPGMPLGMADIASVLWHQFLKHNPQNPHWFNRDRFVVSNGHGSMLLYSLLHLTGYALPISELKHFRQLNAKTPGHPEYRLTPGVETTTGPLGQGLANAVGMALAEKMLAEQFNDTLTTLIDHHTYAFVGDGCLMEGISHEVSSLAGTLGLGKLIVFYDDNGISIDGPVQTWFNDDTAKRFDAYHWQIIGPIDGHNAEAIATAVAAAQKNTTQPTLIICKTIIGYGSPAAGDASTHGAALGQEAIAALRKHFDWPHAPFMIPPDIYAAWDHTEQGAHEEQLWLERCFEYKARRPNDYAEFLRRINGDLPENWAHTTQDWFTQCQTNAKSMATRKASQLCIAHFAASCPELFGGSADLTVSNSTDWPGTQVITKDQWLGNYLEYGVREFGMSAIMTGLALHGGFIPYGGTFLVFSDYSRAAVRLAAMMQQRVIFIFSHDSIGLGEDGPTHQPVEQTSGLRLIPNIQIWRPADLLETAVAWEKSLEHHTGPSSLLLSRQTLPHIPRTKEQQAKIAKGGYIVSDSAESPTLIIMATGSELSIALAGAETLREEGIATRVVSMPCVEQFLAQDPTYQESVLPPHVRKRIAIEAGASAFWYRFVGLDGVVIGIDRFGESAPGDTIFANLGFTAERIKAEGLRLNHTAALA